MGPESGTMKQIEHSKRVALAITVVAIEEAIFTVDTKLECLLFYVRRPKIYFAKFQENKLTVLPGRFKKVAKF